MATTTVTAETRNNTAAVDSFPGSYTGLPPAGNTSKVGFKALLGAHDVPIFAHLMPWGHKDGTSHPFWKTVGYDSPDATQVRRQIADMVESGIDGVIIDWYGRPKTAGAKWEDDCANQFFIQSGNFPNFKVALMLDAGAYRDPAITNKAAEYLACQRYAADRYYGHPRYWRINGRPVFPSFGDAAYSMDWNAIRAGVSGSPLLIFRNSGGFTHAQSDGAYSWLSQSDVLAAGRAHPSKVMISSAKPGFDDRLASWSKNRVTPRANGQVWLDSFKAIKAALDAGQRVDAIQLVTWNDYEEGTAIECGITGALACFPSMVHSDLQWFLSGNINTVDHFQLFESTDGVNLNLVATLPAAARSFDVGSLKLSPGVHRFFIKVVGKPRIQNFFSRSVSFTPIAAPAVSLAPPDGAHVTNPFTMIATANMTGRVELWLDGTKLAENTGTTCSATKTLAKGGHRIVAQLVVNSGVAAKAVSNVTVS
jgi:hypothetical protein